MPSVLVVGSVAFDTIETPRGTAPFVLGGAASYFSVSANFFTKVALVAVVGEDFPEEHRQFFQQSGIDTTGLVTQKGGKTFYWKGRYHQDLNTRDTLEVHLNVIADYQPELPVAYRGIPYIFLANSSPVTHLKVLSQMQQPEMVMADTMDFWLETQRDALMELLPKLDGFVLNDSEAKLLTDEDNLITAGEKVRAMGPKFVIIKKGEHGSMLFSRDGVVVLPAFPTANVVDPTGAGDSFAGGIMGYLATEPETVPGRLRRAMAHGTVLASLTVEDFGLDRLKKISRAEIDQRYAQYKQMLAF
jgi:sugar/nucleoside kinase (ribokinase family)